MAKLLTKLANSAVAKVKLLVNKEQVAAVKLYEGFGFKITGEENIALGDGGAHIEYVLGKELV